MGGARGRILVISARVGAGHHGSTEELARRLTVAGFTVESHDFIDILPGATGRASLLAYNRVIQRAPWVFGALFGVGNWPTTVPLTRALLHPARDPIMRLVGSDTRAVVSTYSLASQVLGSLRREGRLRVPTITYTTDFGVHRHWVAPGVDAHLTPHPLGADQARAQGGRGARAAGALVAPGFQPAPAEGRGAARDRYGLPPGRLALVVAGSWGVGRVEATAADVRASGVATPVVVCGRNESLRRRLAGYGVPALGWVEDMPRLMQAVDVLVENAGGLMALEGMACGLPVATYRPIPGHGRVSAAALNQAGVSTWVRHPDDLGPVLTELMHGARGERQRAAARFMFQEDAAAYVAAVALSPTVRSSVHASSIRASAVHASSVRSSARASAVRASSVHMRVP